MEYLPITIIFILILLFPGLISALITFVLPKQFVITYVRIFIILAVWFYAQMIQVPYPNDLGDRFAGFDNEIYWANIITAVLAILIKFILIATRKHRVFINKEDYDRQLNILRTIDYAICIIYGFLAAYLLTLLHGDIFAGYQPAYQVYLLSAVSLMLLGSSNVLITSIRPNTIFYTFKRYFQFFSYSLCAAMSVLLIFSLSIPIFVVVDTNKVISASYDTDSTYCIQMLTSNGIEKYQNITTLLDLSPLTMWSKATLGNSFGWGNSYFHALLVVKKQSSTDLYNWSYQQRKWSYLKPGFAEIAMIDPPKIICTPQKDFLKQIPWIFSKKNL